MLYKFIMQLRRREMTPRLTELVFGLGSPMWSSMVSWYNTKFLMIGNKIIDYLLKRGFFFFFFFLMSNGHSITQS